MSQGEIIRIALEVISMMAGLAFAGYGGLKLLNRTSWRADIGEETMSRTDAKVEALSSRLAEHIKYSDTKLVPREEIKQGHKDSEDRAVQRAREMDLELRQDVSDRFVKNEALKSAIDTFNSNLQRTDSKLDMLLERSLPHKQPRTA